MVRHRTVDQQTDPPDTAPHGSERRRQDSRPRSQPDGRCLRRLSLHDPTGRGQRMGRSRRSGADHPIRSGHRTARGLSGVRPRGVRPDLGCHLTNRTKKLAVAMLYRDGASTASDLSQRWGGSSSSFYAYRARLVNAGLIRPETKGSVTFAHPSARALVLEQAKSDGMAPHTRRHTHPTRPNARPPRSRRHRRYDHHPRATPHDHQPRPLSAFVLGESLCLSPRSILSLRTQVPRTPAPIPRSRATQAIGLRVSRTICTAPARNSGAYLRRICVM